MTTLLFWAIFGGLIGWIASMLMKSDARESSLPDIIIGILGAILGGLTMRAIGGENITTTDIVSLLPAILGAVALLTIAKKLFDINRGDT
ncbi:MAG TPA: GlsB/YeaQ/YmgE family stress response membrane protein [Candidatus Saccharimonadales bacterium]|nr:GlsB/YeaQ/YmgE family stress response membrane protein [Candidatus Saccharimonadales bacterium]